MHTIMEEIARVMKIGLSCGVTIRKASICASLSTKANSRTKATGHMIFSSPESHQEYFVAHSSHIQANIVADHDVYHQK